MADALRRHGVAALLAMFAVALAVTLLALPIPQDPAYHIFADTRTCLGVANFGNVASNAGFALTGALGLWTVLGPGRERLFERSADALPYVVFFAAVASVSAGSAYYHELPGNDRLFWDRLPMTAAFMAFFYAFLADRVPGIAERHRWLLAVLIALGVGSLVYWLMTENAGHGDLRFYGLVQFFPMLALPAVCWLYPKGRHTDGRYLAWILFWYGLAKVFETFDTEVYDLAGRAVSGHSLKHIASAVATLVVWRMLTAPKA